MRCTVIQANKNPPIANMLKNLADYAMDEEEIEVSAARPSIMYDMPFFFLRGGGGYLGLALKSNHLRFPANTHCILRWYPHAFTELSGAEH